MNSSMIRPPSMVLLEVTNRCGEECRHCYMGSQNVAREHRLREIERAIEEFSEWGVSRLVVSGGEPLKHPHFIEICRKAKSEALETVVATNGILIRQEPFRHLNYEDVDLFQVSMDGPRAIHDAQRRKGSYDATMDGIGILLSAGKRVTLRCTVSSVNIRHCEDLLRVSSELGLSIDLGLVKPTGNARNESMIEPNDYFHLIEKIRYSPERSCVVSSQSCHPIGAYLDGLKHSRNCIGGSGMAALTVSGSFLPCPYMSPMNSLVCRGKLIEFPLFSSDFRETWTSHALFRFFRESGCVDCLLNAIHLGDTPDLVDPYGVAAYEEWRRQNCPK